MLSKVLSRVIKDNRVTVSERKQLGAFVGTFDQERVTLVLSKGGLAAKRSMYRKLFSPRKPTGDPTSLIPVAPGDGRISFGDIQNPTQGFEGSCAIIAASFDNVKYAVNDDASWTFRFQRDIYVTVSPERAITGATGEFGVLERAYATYLDITGVKKSGTSGWQEMSDGNGADPVIFALTGRIPVTADAWIPQESSAIDFDLQRGRTIIISNWAAKSGTIISGHAYRLVLGATGGYDAVNPWGYNPTTPSATLHFSSWSSLRSSFSEGTYTSG